MLIWQWPIFYKGSKLQSKTIPRTFNKQVNPRIERHGSIDWLVTGKITQPLYPDAYQKYLKDLDYAKSNK